jgi:hypothetical protein
VDAQVTWSNEYSTLNPKDEENLIRWELNIQDLHAPSNPIEMDSIKVIGRTVSAQLNGLLRLDGWLYNLIRSIAEKVLNKDTSRIYTLEFANHPVNPLDHFYQPGVPQRISVDADVHLKPFVGTVDGQELNTVVRMRHGESKSWKDWTGNCLCLLVGTRLKLCVLMVLGRSLRRSGAWERLGLAHRVPAEVFDSSEQQELLIV